MRILNVMVMPLKRSKILISFSSLFFRKRKREGGREGEEGGRRRKREGAREKEGEGRRERERERGREREGGRERERERYIYIYSVRANVRLRKMTIRSTRFEHCLKFQT